MDLLDNKVVITVSSRALFKLEDSNKVFEDSGLDEFEKYQVSREEDLLGKGFAYDLIKKILEIQLPKTKERAFEVVLISRNNANTGLRVFNSIQKYGLDISRAAFTSGSSPYKYLSSFNSSLFLSFDSKDVKEALENGFAAAKILSNVEYEDDDTTLRIAFDGDAVIFSDEAEKIFQEKGLDAFKSNEAKKENIPLQAGPFKEFLLAVNKIQRGFGKNPSIRTALVTARNSPSHKRAIKTLRTWGVSIDEAFFLGGLDKVPVLKEFKPHIFFDDSFSYCLPASRFVSTGHVSSGIKNK